MLQLKIYTELMSGKGTALVVCAIKSFICWYVLDIEERDNLSYFRVSVTEKC